MARQKDRSGKRHRHTEENTLKDPEKERERKGEGRKEAIEDTQREIQVRPTYSTCDSGHSASRLSPPTTAHTASPLILRAIREVRPEGKEEKRKSLKG